MRKTLVSVAAAIVAAHSGLSANAEENKTQYNLLNPTPADSLRPMSSTLIDDVETPYTVDAGHFQLDARLISAFFYEDKRTYPNGVSIDFNERILAWDPIFELGVLNNVDFEVIPTFRDQHEEETVTTQFGQGYFQSSSHDFGNVITRAKINLWGNDGGITAFALIPHLDISTDGHDPMGGVAFPFAIHLPQNYLVKLGPDIYTIPNGSKVETHFSNGISIEHLLVEKLTVFWSLTAEVTTIRNQDWWGYTGLGAGYQFTPNFQTYAGMRFGLEQAFDYNPYLGVTFRF